MRSVRLRDLRGMSTPSGMDTGYATAPSGSILGQDSFLSPYPPYPPLVAAWVPVSSLLRARSRTLLFEDAWDDPGSAETVPLEYRARVECSWDTGGPSPGNQKATFSRGLAMAVVT